MNAEAIFILGVPAVCAALIVWMIASGATRTNAMGSGETSPYPEHLDAFGRWVIAIGSAGLYIFLAVYGDALTAAKIFAALLALDLVGAFIWTCAQEISGLRQSRTHGGAVVASVSFVTRLFRNVRDFYATIVFGIIQFGI